MYSFGSGLSYTTFEHSVTLSADSVAASAINAEVTQNLSQHSTWLTVNVVVSNTGDMDGDEVVLLYSIPPNAGLNGIPTQNLAAFKRVHVPAGRDVTVQFSLTTDEFLLANEEGLPYVLKGTWGFRVNTSSQVIAFSVQ